MRADGLDRLERGDTMAALEFARGKVSGAGSASYLLGMNRSPLASRMRALGIRRAYPGLSRSPRPQAHRPLHQDGQLSIRGLAAVIPARGRLHAAIGAGAASRAITELTPLDGHFAQLRGHWAK